ncbi:MAG: hypothetical protein WC862_02475 [Patescibacteria group bacterium]
MENQNTQPKETTLDDVLLAVKDGFDGVSEELNEVKADVSTLKADVSSMKNTINTLPTKSYLDDKNADLAAEIGRRIERSIQREKQFHLKILDLLGRYNIGRPEEIKELEAMV